jgi:hypothetical protein
VIVLAIDGFDIRRIGWWNKHPFKVLEFPFLFIGILRFEFVMTNDHGELRGNVLDQKFLEMAR